MAGLGKHELRERGRAFKPGAWDDKDGTREACWQAKASSFDFHSSGVKANTRLRRLFPIWAAQQQELFSEMAGSSPGATIPTGAQPHSEPAEVGPLALSTGSVRMANEIRKKDASSLGIRILGGEKRVLAYTAALPKGTWRR